MEFRLSDAGRLMEAAVGRRAEDVMDGQARGGYIFDFVHTCHVVTIQTRFLTLFFLKRRRRRRRRKSSFMELWLS